MHNREFKFRVWDIINLEFNYSDSRQFLIGLNGLVYDGNGSLYDESHIIQQFTGLKDKNGKEIYEGDIIKIKFYRIGEQICEIKYHFMSFQFMSINSDKNSIPMFFNGDFEKIEIIGNIFENPEMLKS